MTVTTAQKMTFQEFLNYDDGTDNFYELENRELIVMPLEWVEGLYEEQVFTGDEMICSPLFSEVKYSLISSDR